ncbi:hypothetical protein FQA39_LY10662 [Lamprigera yunnana]|nr:hypothetical protein FQA39_LY10662 [Lamprigera yunnana]
MATVRKSGLKRYIWGRFQNLESNNNNQIIIMLCAFCTAFYITGSSGEVMTEVSAEDIGEWMVCDSADPGFQCLNDDELIESVREESVEEEDNLNVEVDTRPSASEAFSGLETALRWMERQPECDHMQLLTVKRMRDLAARKRMTTVEQLTLIEMLSKQ